MLSLAGSWSALTSTARCRHRSLSLSNSHQDQLGSHGGWIICTYGSLLNTNPFRRYTPIPAGPADSSILQLRAWVHEFLHIDELSHSVARSNEMEVHKTSHKDVEDMPRVTLKQSSRTLRASYDVVSKIQSCSRRISAAHYGTIVDVVIRLASDLFFVEREYIAARYEPLVWTARVKAELTSRTITTVSCPCR